MALKKLKIRDKIVEHCIIQGGMGVGVSLHPLAKAVAQNGGIGVISSVALDRLLSKRNGKKYSIYEACEEEVALAKDGSNCIGINIMVAVQKDYEASVKGAIAGGVDIIISGAGLPTELPKVASSKDVALVPIVSSLRAFDIICKRWERFGARPDAVVVEGPLAGGHLGFRFADLEKEENKLENLLPPIKEKAIKCGDIPVIVAGGIYTHDDIKKFLDMGADGVQMGTRFLATFESSATFEYKQAVIRADKDDIVVAYRPGSPSGLPFRVIKSSPMYQDALLAKRHPNCDKGYLLNKDGYCPAMVDNVNYFCICNGLLSSAGYNSDKEKPIYTVGANAYRVDRLLSVEELMKELVYG
jgi:nitronate monooxygenase